MSVTPLPTLLSSPLLSLLLSPLTARALCASPSSSFLDCPLSHAPPRLSTLPSTLFHPLFLSPPLLPPPRLYPLHTPSPTLPTLLPALPLAPPLATPPPHPPPPPAPILRSLFIGTPSWYVQQPGHTWSNVASALDLIPTLHNTSEWSDAWNVLKKGGFRFDVSRLDESGIPRDSTEMIVRRLMTLLPTIHT